MAGISAQVFKISWINGWKLFFLIAIPISALVIYEMSRTDIRTGEGLSHMIGYSVRFAVPIIFIVIAASSYHVLFPSEFSKWWFRNRKYIGLTFAVAMAWQGAFIFVVSTFTRDYYFTEIYFFRDELEGSIGYIFLIGMVFTSFAFARKHLSSHQWKLIQKGGVYFLWAYAFSVYWWNLYYYPLQDEPRIPEYHDHVFYWMGFTAFALRIAAWGKKRNQVTEKNRLVTPVFNKLAGGLIIVVGLIGSATGLTWQQPVNAFLLTPAWSAELELWVPFWPFTPFLPLLIIALGTLIYTKSANQTLEGKKITAS